DHSRHFLVEGNPCRTNGCHEQSIGKAALLFFSLFCSFLCRINTCGNLTPVITVFDMTGACSRNG
ncbi:MAG: hypothetical protein WB522_11120, partial [Pseudolabrys sp.]